MARLGRLEKPVQVVGHSGQPAGPEPTRFWGRWSIVLGVLTFTSGLFLLLMFVSIGSGAGPDPWGPINDFLSGIANLLLAALIPVISRRATRSRRGRYGVWLTYGASVVGAASSFLLVTGQVGFESSSAVSIAVIVLQVLWMLWLNRRLLTDSGVPRRVSRYGIIFAGSLLAALILFSTSFLFPAGTWASTALQTVGTAIGGVSWLSWPIWFILLGRHLARVGGVENAENPSTRPEDRVDGGGGQLR